ncbi:hypothetical protein ACQPZX_29675 [Actinoplanes sp. CA-142083]|uniref:hypothetical protein n=1 Tax=Actinoplanes sp. CA-142083 TaxID=3239903 RepID=UPI003D8DAF92
MTLPPAVVAPSPGGSADFLIPLAHGVGQSTDLPLPLDLVLQAGAATVVLSFLASALLWRRPRLTHPTERHPRSTWWRRPLQLLVLAISLYLTAAALFGPRDHNPAAHALFVWLWVGLIPLSVLFGPVWRALNPIRTLARLLRFPAPAQSAAPASTLGPAPTPGPAPARASSGPEPAHASSGPEPAHASSGPEPAHASSGPVPTQASSGPAPAPFVPAAVPVSALTGPPGSVSAPVFAAPVPKTAAGGTAPAADQPWAAAAGLLAFVWLELAAPGRTNPLVIGLCIAGYAVVHLALTARHGANWPARGDFLEVYSDLAGRLSPLRWRPPLSGLAADHPAGAARAAFLAIWWGSTIFDSASGSPAWAGFVQRAGQPLLWSTAGLVAVCGIVFIAVCRLPGRLDVTNSLIPIAVGYTLAHYLTLLLVEGPRGALLLVQQWGIADGATWDVVPDPHVVSILQVALILAGHMLGVLAAHDMALADNPGRPPLAVLADELPVVLFMIFCTWAGLFLLFVR